MVLERAEMGIASRWGWVVTKGVIGVLFGLVAFSRPGAMAFSMVLLFGCFAFASGIATIIAAARSGRAGDSWGALLLEGLLAIAVGDADASRADADGFGVAAVSRSRSRKKSFSA